jgi:hypothetical protein
MLTIWAIAFVLGLIALCVSLWVTFWVVLYVVVFFRVAHQDLSYRRAEKHHPGIYARFQRTLALREAKRKEKEAYEKWSAERMKSIYKRERQASAHRTAAAWAAFANS